MNGKSKKSLVLQEDLLLLFVLKKMLESIGYQCEAIDNIDLLNGEDKTHFDLVITDVLFKGHAPLELISQIKDSLSFGKIYIVSDMELSKLRKSISNIQPIDGFYETPIDLDKFKNNLLEQ